MALREEIGLNLIYPFDIYRTIAKSNKSGSNRSKFSRFIQVVGRLVQKKESCSIGCQAFGFFQIKGQYFPSLSQNSGVCCWIIP